MNAVIHAFRDEADQAKRLAQALDASLAFIETHRFPDGELLPQVAQPATTIIVYRSLHHANEKLLELLLAADALRRYGARRIILAAPYLCYMRQDKAFAPGQPVSQRVVAGLLDVAFDRVVTVDPHLHRVNTLAELFPTGASTNLNAADAIAPFLRGRPGPAGLMIVGPDAEASQWVERLAKGVGCDWSFMTKQRLGDRQVVLDLPHSLNVAGRPIVLADDVCSSGATLIAATRALKVAGARSVQIAVTHALCDDQVVDSLMAAGATGMISTDSCTHSTNRVNLAPLLAEAMRMEL